MALSELSSRDAVLAAIKEFDDLGREAFLKKYGFGPARHIFIEHGDHHYDSKAIAGVAYGHQFPDRGPLKPNEFSGGEETVSHVLEQLGFSMSDGLSADTPGIPATGSDAPSRAWIFQANPGLYDLQGAVQALGQLTWLVKQHKDDIKEGDTVFLWEGGSDAGIIAVAQVIEGPALRGDNPQEADFVRDADKFAGEQLRVLLRVERVLKDRISRVDLRKHPVLHNMTILKAPQGTNFALSDDEVRALTALIPRGTMALTLEDVEAMMTGFAKAGFQCSEQPTSHRNPVVVEWHTGKDVRRYRLWAFDVTHGGGGPTVRAADEFRIQITNGPSSLADIDKDGTTDLLVGYSRDRDSIIAYDRRWLERWIDKTSGGERGSPSVQVKEADIQAGHDKGVHHLTKTANFGQADIVTMSPAMLPAYLMNHQAVLRGTMTAEQAKSASPNLGESTIVDYCRAQGFPFEADLLARYIAALLTKPFVILAGISGTGKSKLAELVAEYYSATATAASASSEPAPGDKFVFVPGRGAPDPKRFALVAVRPDWIDNQSILGFVNPITGSYESTQALDLILRADQALAAASDRSAAPRYFMLLDEMNLARVEHYFSDWLSCAESRRLRPDGTVSQQPVPLHRSKDAMDAQVSNPDGTTVTVSVPAMLTLPTNLVVTGTVNVDETTFGFSPKVLDRAMVIEFDEVNLDQLRAGTSGSGGAANYRFPETLLPFRLATAEDFGRLPIGTHKHLVAINGILEEARLHLGYRAANEAALFMTIYNDILPERATDADWQRALDAAVLQKLLPRLSGNRAKLEAPLSKLCLYLRDLKLPAGDVNLEEFDPAASAALPKSYRRTVEMLDALRGFGFVSFFK
jgi:hypothetical protein